MLCSQETVATHCEHTNKEDKKREDFYAFTVSISYIPHSKVEGAESIAKQQENSHCVIKLDGFHASHKLNITLVRRL